MKVVDQIQDKSLEAVIIYEGLNPKGDILIPIHRKCQFCNQKHLFKIAKNDYDQWAINRRLIQGAFPYFNNDQRELLISSICGSCWKIVFGKE